MIIDYVIVQKTYRICFEVGSNYSYCWNLLVYHSGGFRHLVFFMYQCDIFNLV